MASESVLERQRSAHEWLENLENAMVKEMLEKPKQHKEKLIQQHRLLSLLDQIQQKSQYLHETYQDVDGRMSAGSGLPVIDDRARKAEIAAISGATEFSEFYQRLKNIKDYHRRFPNETVEPVELEIARRDVVFEESELDAIFSGEEGFGKFLDLNVTFDLYVNLKKVKKINYVTYMMNFDEFESIPRETKKTPEYARYLDELKTYLESFFHRTQPLLNLEVSRNEAMRHFNEMWEQRKEGAGANGGADGGDAMDEDEQDSHRALFCVPCGKQFAKKTVFDGHLGGKKHKAAVKALTGSKSNGAGADAEEGSGGGLLQKLQLEKEREKSVALSEALIAHYGSMLKPIRDETVENVHMKQTTLGIEREVDVEEAPIDLGEDSEDDEKIYNPLKLPLGWDGKPIPYWLYKLHGLGVEYPCEICGNFVYMGRKTFERHFQEWRHAHGMRCLGIPNTRHFHEITNIADAYALWEKLKTQSRQESFKADAMEEFEDAEGNVFNKKTFEEIEVGPRSADLFIERATWYQENGPQWDKAIEDLRTAVALEGSSGKASIRLQQVIQAAASARVKAEEKISVKSLLAVACGEQTGASTGGVAERVDACKRLIVLAADENVARRIVEEGNVPGIVGAFVAIRGDGRTKKGAEDAEGDRLDVALVRLLIRLASVKENALTIIEQLTADRVLVFMDRRDVQVALLSLELSGTLVFHLGEGTESVIGMALLGIVDDFMAPTSDPDLRLAAANCLIKIAATEASAVRIVGGKTLSLVLQLVTGATNAKLRTVVPVALARIFDLLTDKSESTAKETCKTLIERWLGMGSKEKTLGLTSFASIFAARSSFGAYILLSEGMLEEIMDILEYETAEVQHATVEVLSSSCADEECRKAVAARCSAYLRKASAGTDAKLRTVASTTLIKIMFVDKEAESAVFKGDRIVLSFINTIKCGESEAEKMSAVEPLAYLTVRPAIKEMVTADTDLLKALFALAKVDDLSTLYGLATILANVSTRRRKLSSEEEQLKKLKQMSGDKADPDDPLDNDDKVEARGAILVAAGVISVLSKMASSAGVNLSSALARTFLNLATDRRNRGRMVQEGAVKALIGLTTTADDAGRNAAAQSLAKIAITSDPTVAFKGQRAAELVRPLLHLCNGEDQLGQFEALMALTNLASVDDDLRNRIVQAKGVKAMEFLQFSDNEMVRRAATEALCNMMFHEQVYKSYAADSTPGRLRMMIALCDVEDFETRRAASGALAILSSHPNTCKVLVNDSRGLEILMGILKDEDHPEVMHRAVETLKNIAGEGVAYCQKIDSFGAVPLLRALVRHPMQEVAAGSIETLQIMRKAGITVTSK
ncbi:hypothetical protein HK101_001679 [Irineochytrium annulatum]|nr:hypothetical protein HK101_001679 [Irineochytrium annulatum]